MTLLASDRCRQVVQLDYSESITDDPRGGATLSQLKKQGGEQGRGREIGLR